MFDTPALYPFLCFFNNGVWVQQTVSACSFIAFCWWPPQQTLISTLSCSSPTPSVSPSSSLLVNTAQSHRVWLNQDLSQPYTPILYNFTSGFQMTSSIFRCCSICASYRTVVSSSAEHRSSPTADIRCLRRSLKDPTEDIFTPTDGWV